MNEQELEQRMRTAVADAPPLNFDPDRLIDTAVQRQRRRRAVLGSVAAVAVVAGSAIALTSTPDVASDSRRLPVAESQDRLPDGVPEPPAALRHSVEQMTAYLQQRVPQVVPEASDVRVGTWFRLLADGDAAGSGVQFTMNGSPRLLDLGVIASSPTQDDNACSDWKVAGPMDRCDVDPQSDGSTLVVVETSFGDGKATGIRVFHLRVDGVWVYFASGGIAGEPSLTEAQLTELATDPKFGVYE